MASGEANRDLTSASPLASHRSGWWLQTQLKHLHFPLLNYISVHLKPNKLNRSAASGGEGKFLPTNLLWP